MLATVAVLVALAAVPVRADNEDDLRRAKERVAKVQAELDAATAAYQQAFGQFVATQDRIVETRERMARTRQRLKRLRASLAARARQAYQQGAAGTLELLLSSNSFAEFADRAAFLDRMSQGESDLILRAQVTRESLTRQRDDLDALAAEQASTTKVLSQQQAAIDAKFGELLAIEDDLEQKLASERAAAAALTRIAPGTVIRGAAARRPDTSGQRYPRAPRDPGGGGARRRGQHASERPRGQRALRHPLERGLHVLRAPRFVRGGCAHRVGRRADRDRREHRERQRRPDPPALRVPPRRRRGRRSLPLPAGRLRVGRSRSRSRASPRAQPGGGSGGAAGASGAVGGGDGARAAREPPRRTL